MRFLALVFANFLCKYEGRHSHGAKYETIKPLLGLPILYTSMLVLLDMLGFHLTLLAVLCFHCVHSRESPLSLFHVLVALLCFSAMD